MARKIQRVTITVDVEVTGRRAMPPRRDLADGLRLHLEDSVVEVTTPDSVGGVKVVEVQVIGAYSKLAGNEADRVAPDLKELRAT